LSEFDPKKCKESQIKPNKKAWISLFFLGRIGTFQWVTANPSKKFAQPLENPLWLYTRGDARRMIFVRRDHSDADGQLSSQMIIVPISLLRNKMPEICELLSLSLSQMSAPYDRGRSVPY
jgi:hypothetical protein